MAYEYRVNEEESAARNLLEDRGWDVRPPRCPECHGAGMIITYKNDLVKGGKKKKYVVNWTSVPCPNECPTPMMFY